MISSKNSNFIYLTPFTKPLLQILLVGANVRKSWHWQ